MSLAPPHYPVLRQRYHFARWKHDSATPIFALSPTLDPGWAFVERRPVPGSRGQYRDLFTNPADHDQRVLVHIHQFDSVNSAHEGLLEALSLSMAPVLPAAHEVGIEVGDVAFGGLGAVQTSVLFVRGPILVSVDSIGPKEVSVQRVAEAVDHAIGAHLRRSASAP